MKPRKTPTKILASFKLRPDIKQRLDGAAKRENRTRTAILEMALVEWLSVKR
jgi:predicted transcriptional regulator